MQEFGGKVLAAFFQIGVYRGDAGDAPEALPLDSAKGTFEKRIGARANSAKSLCDIRVPLEPPKLFWLRIMKRNGDAR